MLTLTLALLACPEEKKEPEDTGTPCTGTFYADVDGDGYGDPDRVATACVAPDGYVEDPSDCNDSVAAVNPAAIETCNGADDDCDGLVDESGDNGPTFYADADGDGFGDPTVTLVACSAPEGYTADATDCDDTLSGVYPGAPEYCNDIDDDCDGDIDEAGAVDETTFYADGDGDGFGAPGESTSACTAPDGYAAEGTDCDDIDPEVNPAATEVCNEVDDDCDDLVDDADDSLDPASLYTWYYDKDGDGYGDAATSTESCAQPVDYVADSSDCNDKNAATNPGAAEVCNNVDDDCDGLADDDDPSLVTDTANYWFADADGDGYGDSGASVRTCDIPTGYVPDSSDCDDTDASINPGATEVCNGDVDDDCNGLTDDADPGLDTTTSSAWHPDSDGDGYGSDSSTFFQCDQPSGYLADDSDCDDTDAAVNPGAVETYNGVDDDCDGVVDEGVTPDTVLMAWEWGFDADQRTSERSGARIAVALAPQFGEERCTGSWSLAALSTTPVASGCPSCTWSFAGVAGAGSQSGSSCSGPGYDFSTEFSSFDAVYSGATISLGASSGYSYTTDWGATYSFSEVVWMDVDSTGWYALSYNGGAAQAFYAHTTDALYYTESYYGFRPMRTDTGGYEYRYVYY